MNLRLAEKVIRELVAIGVKEFCLCAGARNSPFVVLLEKARGIQVYSFFEERSAAFFALGRGKKTRRPVAVVTTSGTAVAELIPAAIEATYSGQPLLFLTADRPREFRNKGAPQSIEQVGIFTRYAQMTIDIASIDDPRPLQDWNFSQPLHLNVCFSEPLIDATIPALDFLNEPAAAFKGHEWPLQNYEIAKRTLARPLVIIGELPGHQVEFIADFLLRFRSPIYAESISNLRGVSALSSLFLRGGDKTIQQLFTQQYCDSVLRIGGVPTCRFWRDLEEKYQHLPVISVSELHYPGLSRSTEHLLGYKYLSGLSADWQRDTRQQIFVLDQEIADKLNQLVNQHLKSEVQLLQRLATHLENKEVYLGNSLPIREWDLVTSPLQKFAAVRANRGANGIDGQISTYLGLSEPEQESWCVVGDLTAMYDLVALWAARKLRQRKLRLVVVNNQGGQIFQSMFDSSAFINAHQIHFEHWAKMWGWSYQCWSEVPAVLPQLADWQLIELVPDAQQSQKFWEEFKFL